MDPFDLLGLPRRPLLSEEEIGTSYRKLTATLHPDQPGGDTARFRELGEAAFILKDPVRRLRELSGSASESPLRPLPLTAAELFPKIATLLHQADSLLEKHSSAGNALVKALLATPLKALQEDLRQTLRGVESWKEVLERELELLDATWPLHDADGVALLADSFAYSGRWERELRERMLALDCILG